MKPTILLTGKSGQIGHELHCLLPSLGCVIAPDRAELDLLDAESIRRAVREHRPSVIVNAAAYTAVDAAESDEQRAHAVNAEAVGVLATAAKEVGALLVHYSTDYVFDGAKRTAYSETDACHPLNAYGRSKLAGEMAIRESGAAHLILRTSWVYATRGKNFLLTILRLATEREELQIVHDQIGAPTCASDIAAGTANMLAGLLGSRGASSVASRSGESAGAPESRAETGAASQCQYERGVSSRSGREGKTAAWPSSSIGTFHMTAAGETSWFEFAGAILEEARAVCEARELSKAREVSEARGVCKIPEWFAAATQGKALIAKRVLPISAAEFRSPTRRPAYSVLSNAQLAKVFHTTLPDWRTQLHRCFTSSRGADAPLT